MSKIARAVVSSFLLLSFLLILSCESETRIGDGSQVDAEQNAVSGLSPPKVVMRPVAHVPSSMSADPGVQYFSVALALEESADFDNALDWASVTHTLSIDGSGGSSLGVDEVRYVPEGSVLSLRAEHEQLGTASSTLEVSGPAYRKVTRSIQSTADDIEVTAVGQKTVYGERLQLRDAGAVGLRFETGDLPRDDVLHNVWLTFRGTPDSDWRYQVRVPSADESLEESLDAPWPDSEPLALYQTQAGHYSTGYLQQLADVLVSNATRVDLRVTGQGQLSSSETLNQPAIQAYYSSITSAVSVSDASTTEGGEASDTSVGSITGPSGPVTDSDDASSATASSRTASLPTVRRGVKSTGGGTHVPSIEALDPHSPQPPSTIAFGEITDQFRVNALGGGNYTIPVSLPMAPGGLTPKLSMSYNSTGGAGLLGAGWSLSGLSTIRRCAKSYARDGERVRVTHQAGDSFCLDGQRLVSVSGNEYRTANDNFQKIVSNGANPQTWTVTGTDGKVYRYGVAIQDQNATNNGRIEGRLANGGALDSAVHTWALASVTDTSDNNFRVFYFENDQHTEHFPLEFRYGSVAGTEIRVLFQYYDHKSEFPNNVRPTYANGYEFAQTRYLKSIEVKRGTTSLHTYFLDYSVEPEIARWQLSTLQYCTPTSCLPTKSFEWTDRESLGASGNWQAPGNDSSPLTGDFNGDGRSDVIRRGEGTCLTRYNLGTNAFTLDCNTSTKYISPTGNAIIADFNGDGLDDYLAKQANAGPGIWRLCRATLTGGTHGFDCSVNPPAFGHDDLTTGDFDGDGRSDVYVSDQKRIFYGDSDPTMPIGFVQVNNVEFKIGNTPVTFGQFEIVEVNGDGASDILGFDAVNDKWYSCTEASGTVQEHAVSSFSCVWEHSGGLPTVPYNQEPTIKLSPADFNADGLTDLAFYNQNSSKWGVFYANGHNSLRRYTEYREVGGGFSGDEKNHLVGDLNGDGRADLATWQTNQWQIAYSAAGPFLVEDGPTSPNPGAMGTDPLSKFIKVGDFNSDGRRDLIKANSGSITVELMDAYSAPLLDKVISTTSVGPKTTLKIVYGYTTKEPTKASTYPNRTTWNTHVVRSSSVPGNRVGEDHQTTYDFDELLVNKRGLGILGFNKRAETDERRRVRKTYSYHDKYPFFGRVNQVVTATEKGGVFNNQKVKFYKYTAEGLNYEFTTIGDPDAPLYNEQPDENLPEEYWVYTKEEEVHDYDYHTNTHVSKTTSIFSHDFNGSGRAISFGGVDDITRTTVDLINNVTWTETTGNTYDSEQTTPYLLRGKLNRSEVTSNSTALSSAGAVQKVRAFEYNSKGQLDALTIEPDKTPRHEYLRTEYLYDGYGNVSEERSKGFTLGYQALPDRVTATVTTYPLTGSNSSRPVKKEVVTNVVTSTESQSITVESDLDHGQPLHSTDVNGLITTYEYDDFGQKPKITAPDGTYTHVSDFTWLASGSSGQAEYHKKTVYKAGAPGSSVEVQKPLHEYFDAHGNLVRTRQMKWHSTKSVNVEYTYDSLGRLTHETTPYYDGQGYRTTIRQYVDNTNDLLKLIDYRGPQQSYSYNKYTTTRTDTDGHVHKETRNAMGQVLKVEEGDPANLTAVSYVYDDAGRVRHITDEENNTITQTYDVRDNRWSLVDPDLGRTDYRYDSYGAPVWQRNARNQVTRFYYDNLGRLTKQNDPDSIEFLNYDTQPNGKGQLAEIAYKKPGNPFHYRKTPEYDSLGRLSRSTECIGAVGSGCTDFVTEYDYDAYSRLETTTLPGGKQVKREYHNNILSNLKRADGTRIWQVNNKDALGRPYAERAGNGVFTRYTYNWSTTDGGGMLGSVRSHHETTPNTNLMHRVYTYDLTNAQLKSREDVDFARVETFGYDKHRRISTVELKHNGSVIDNYTYGYDSLGNITSKPDQAETLNQPYTYGEGITVDGAGPHAIKSLGSRSFTYDAGGNLLSDGNRTARWMSFDKPEMLRKGTATIWFEYGAGNNRIRRRQGNFNTWYLNGGPDVQIERLTHNNNSNVTTKFHYRVEGRVVGIDEETASGTESRYLHSDRLGSASVMTDDTGAVLERMSYDVWGQVQSLTQGSESTVLESGYHTKSYTGHEALADTDLVHMNGRIYDPILGRFLSADPFVQFAYNSQSYNRYSYVLNNPLGWTDPSGYLGDSVDGEGHARSSWSPDNTKTWSGHSRGSSVIGNQGADGATAADLGTDDPARLGAALPGDGDNDGITDNDEIGELDVGDIELILPYDLVDKDGINKLGPIVPIRPLPGKGANQKSLSKQLNLTLEKQRELLRSEMGTSGTGKVAHHVIPLEAIKRFPELIRKAAQGGFNINGKNNGAALSREEHIGGHPRYNRAVMDELNSIDRTLSPARTATELQKAADTLRKSIHEGTFGPWG